jgi:predicted Zn-dependent peptidase
LQREYIMHTLPNGIRLFFLPTSKFKTISVGFFIHQELNSNLAALNALLTSVLEKGCRLYPEYLLLQRRLEQLYGAELATDIIKSGERHTLSFTLEMAHDRFIGQDSNVLADGLSILSSLITDPLLENQAFRAAYVKQEKNQLIKDIRALLNDKAAYASERCLALMCANERFGVYKLGRIEDYKTINPEDLYHYYQQVLANNPIDLYVVGDLAEEKLLEKVEAVFNFPRDGKQVVLPDTVLSQAPDQPQYFEEKMQVNQAKLVLGYRTTTGFRDDLFFPLMVYSGILGGFPHSKLFLKVREEAGLAYYINSRLERHKGLLLIAAGINYENFEQARIIIDRQLEDMTKGTISDAELDHTKRGLTNNLLSRQDSPSQLISFHLDGTIGGRNYTVTEVKEGIETVGREEIMAVAERIKLDTVYLLRPDDGGDKTDDYTL